MKAPTTAPPGATTPSGDPVDIETAPPPTLSPLPATPIPGPIAFGDAQVVAQGIVEFPTGTFRWDQQQLDSGVWPYLLDTSPAAFFVADGPDAVLVSDDSGPLALLDAGEATFVPSGSSGAVSPLFADAEASARRITFVNDAGPGTFVPRETRRDVNLIRGILDQEDSIGVLSPFPILVVVTEGEVVDSTETIIDVDAGPVTLEPNIVLRNDGTEPATVLIATVGGDVG